jgi:hypothetical protein
MEESEGFDSPQLHSSRHLAVALQPASARAWTAGTSGTPASSRCSCT